MEVAKVHHLPALGTRLILDSQLEGWAASGRWFIVFGCFLSGSWSGLMRRGGARRPCGGSLASKKGEREARPGFALITLFAWQPF